MDTSTALAMTLLGRDVTGRSANPQGFTLKVMRDGFDPGSPDAIKSVVASLLGAGDLSYINRFGNRVVRFDLEIDGTNSDALAIGEAMIQLGLSQLVPGNGGEVTWTPVDGLGATSVCEVLNGTMKPSDQGRAGQRVFTIELECRPWVRAATKSSVTFIPGTGTPVVFDACNSVSPNWSGGNLTGTASWLGDTAIKAEHQQIFLPSRWNGASPPTQNFIGIDIAPGAGSWHIRPPMIDLSGGSSFQGEDPILIEALANGYTRFWYPRPATMPIDFYIFGAYAGPNPYNPVFYIGSLVQSNALPASGVMNLAVGGSVPTEGSVIMDNTSGFDNVFIYADPALLTGFNPAVPAAWKYGLAGPGDKYSFWLNRTLVPTSPVVNDTLTVTATLGSASQAQTTRLDAAAVSRKWIPIGLFDLGALRTQRVGDVVFTASHSGGFGTEVVTVDNTTSRIFRERPGETALTYWPGSAGADQLVLDVPSLEYPNGGLWADGADIMDAAVSWEAPPLVPPLTAMFIESGTAGWAARAEFYARFGHNAVK